MNPLKERVVQALQIPGLTQDGGAWLAKALHPSDAVNVVQGIPTMDSVPSASLNFMSTATITAPAADTWGAQVQLTPTPEYFAKVSSYTAGGVLGSSTIVNSSLGVTSPTAEYGAAARTWHSAAIKAFSNNVSQYRLTYASMTVVLSSNATSNQGSVVCAQYPLSSQGPAAFTTSDETGASYISYAARPCYMWDLTRPTPAALQAIPGSVQWEARKGIYGILKLDGNFDQWHSSKATTLEMGVAGGGSAGTDGSVLHLNDATDYCALAAAAVPDVLFGTNGIWPNVTLSAAADPSKATITQQTVAQHHPTCSNTVLAIFSDLDATAALTITVRVGFEAIVPPTSIYIGQVGAPVHYDPVALASYFDISRNMLAAYPADYNAFGALFNVIKGVASAALPAIKGVVAGVGNSFVPGLGSAASSIIDSATNQSINPLPMRPVAMLQRNNLPVLRRPVKQQKGKKQRRLRR